MRQSTVSSIKRSQKESLYLRTIGKLFNQVAQDDAKLRGIFISRVMLSDDKSHLTVLFHSMEGEEHFQKVFDALVVYKPSLRKALAQEIQSRYTPDIVFKYDVMFDKIQRVESLIDQVSPREDEDDENS
jgi:ribosome-binding factor A